MDKELILKNYNEIYQNIEKIKEIFNIKNSVEIAAVTKYTSEENIKNLISIFPDIALLESKAQSLRDRAGSIESENWQFIGHIQKNKIKYIVKYAKLIQSVDSLEIIEDINKEALKYSKIQNILLQFNISDEKQKGGFDCAEYEKVYESTLGFNNIKVVGVMGIASFSEDEYLIESEFEKLENIFLKLKGEHFSILSMGMSSDYHLAVKHGSTMLRIGSKLFKN